MSPEERDWNDLILLFHLTRYLALRSFWLMAALVYYLLLSFASPCLALQLLALAFNE